MDFPEKYKQLWWAWEIRVLILLGLFIQIIIIFLSRLRKNTVLRWIQVVLWGSFLIPNLVTNFNLGQLSNIMNDTTSDAIVAFWAPFLILHLVGLNAIMAYSMENNEIWARHLLGLGHILLITFYVFFRSLPNTCLLSPTLLIFLVAIIKNVECSYSLYKATAKGFRGFIDSSDRKLPIEDLNHLNQAFYLYSACRPFFIDLIPDLELYGKIKNLVMKMTTCEILRVTSMELSFAYDEHYTKAITSHSGVGYALRAICSSCFIMAFWLFLIVPKNGFSKFDVVMTYIMLLASICLDIATNIRLVFSDWMVVSLLNFKKLGKWSALLAKHIVRIKNICYKRSYWLIEIPQMNLLSNCLKISAPKEAPHQRVMNWIVEKLKFEQETKLHLGWRTTLNETYTLRTLQPAYATEDIMKIIASYVQKILTVKPNRLAGLYALTEVMDWAIPMFVKLLEALSLDQQIFIWHITTELCFHWNPKYIHPFYPHQREMEEEEIISRVGRKCPEKEACKHLSNYMMHMVLMRPEIIPTMIRASPMLFYCAFDDMVQFIRNYKIQNAEVEEVCIKIMTTPIVWTNNNSLFVIARVLANLMLIIREEETWHVLITTWVELLMQVAKTSRANMHVKQLSCGGELLTFIWLLNKHVGIDDIVDISSNQFMIVEEFLSKIILHLPSAS